VFVGEAIGMLFQMAFHILWQTKYGMRFDLLFEVDSVMESFDEVLATPSYLVEALAQENLCPGMPYNLY
jgi:hypothetical protein